ncbi:MAG: class I SAM-dependent methyltransferase [Fimbriimonadaceae bacterium]|nr:class I SAM-dependent methyltransferase [Fimbriimonadaceae bacterium]
MDLEVWRCQVLDQAVTDFCTWQGWPRDRFFEAAARWGEVGPALWAQSTPTTFYTGWTAEAGQVAVARNLIDQASRLYLFDLLQRIITQAGRPEAYLDYGCGSGLLSYSFLDQLGDAVLCDVPNSNQEFLRWRLAHHQQRNAAAVTPEEAAALPEQTFTLVVCIDVLEHLAEPTAVLQQLHRLLRVGGLLLHRSPWARDDEDLDEHLPEATADWHRPGGGRDFLAQHFRCVVEIESGGLYQRIS